MIPGAELYNNRALYQTWRHQGPCTNLWTYVMAALAKSYNLLGHTEDVLCCKVEMATEFIHVKVYSIESLHG